VNILKEQAVARELSRERKVTESSSIEKPIVAESLRRNVEKNIGEWIEIQKDRKEKERKEREERLIEQQNKVVEKKVIVKSATRSTTKSKLGRISPTKSIVPPQIEIKEDKGKMKLF
jgi:hypothetical protein